MRTEQIAWLKCLKEPKARLEGESNENRADRLAEMAQRTQLLTSRTTLLRENLPPEITKANDSYPRIPLVPLVPGDVYPFNMKRKQFLVKAA